MRTPEVDRALTRRVARVIAVQTAAAVTAMLLVVGGVVYLVQTRTLHRATEQAVRTAAQSSHDLDDKPAGVVLLQQPAGTSGIRLSAGAPAPFATFDVATLPIGLTERQVGDRRYEIFTVVRPSGRLSAALDLSRRSQETDRLLEALAVAGLFGIAGAATVGAVVGRRAMRPATLALALQRRFVADASHELRTPLTIVHTRAQLLRDRLGDLDPDTAAEVEQLVADTRALGDVVQDLLLSAELGARPAAGEVVEFGALVQEVVASFGQLAAQRSVALTTELVEGRLAVQGVAPALRRALGSLLDNALGHVPDGGQIRVEVARRSGRVVLTVADNGEGLDPAALQELLGRFARGTSEGGGRRFGLGLALVQEVVNAHGGRLILGGAPGVGAEISLELPALA